MSELRENVLKSLGALVVPGHDSDPVQLGAIRALSVVGSTVSYVLEPPEGVDAVTLREQIEACMLSVEGVTGVTTHLLADNAVESAPSLTDGPRSVAGVDHVVLVGSGKGGVGKSTVTANLALALADQGLKVGLLDADIYGPSQPRMMGCDGRPVSYDGTLIPIAVHGIKFLSVGLMLAEDEALVWRGPILANTLAQLLHEVRWGPLDVLLIDLPPGTGDVQITLAQEAKLSGAVIVSTPQNVAKDDARRAIDLFQRTDTPVLGVIQNMATYVCRHCGEEDAIFGTDPAAGEWMGLPLLGALPIAPQICSAAEDGQPVVRADPDSLSAQRFLEIADALKVTLSELAAR